MQEIIEFDYDSTPIKHLINIDSRIANLINQVGPYRLTLRSNYFEALAFSIVGQQLSGRVATVLRQRLINLCGVITPIALMECDDEALRTIGISRAKSSYLRSLSLGILENKLLLHQLPKLPNEQVIKELMLIKGIGRWTAEMFLIFSLGRLNVFAEDDVGLQRAIRWLYKLESGPDSSTLKTLKSQWSPFCTVASLYLWEVINQNYISKSDN